MRDGYPTGRRRGRSVSAETVRSAWPLFLCFRPGGVDVTSRRTLEDPVETRRHPLRVVTIVITIPAIVLAGGFFLRLPPLPGLGSTRLVTSSMLRLLKFGSCHHQYCTTYLLSTP